LTQSLSISFAFGHEHVPDEAKWPTAARDGNPYVKDIATITTTVPETYTVVAGRGSHVE
jgi:hypothetical protein